MQERTITIKTDDENFNRFTVYAAEIQKTKKKIIMECITSLMDAHESTKKDLAEDYPEYDPEFDPDYNREVEQVI